MKKMIAHQIISKRILYTDRYFNGQLGVFLYSGSGEPIAELSIMSDSIHLAPNEFILKDYSENEEITQEFLESNSIIPTDRFVLIGPHLCPICQLIS